MGMVTLLEEKPGTVLGIGQTVPGEQALAPEKRVALELLDIAGKRCVEFDLEAGVARGCQSRMAHVDGVGLHAHEIGNDNSYCGAKGNSNARGIRDVDAPNLPVERGERESRRGSRGKEDIDELGPSAAATSGAASAAWELVIARGQGESRH